MLNLHTNIVLDENQKPIAVQIPIDDFQRLEEVIENYGLSRLISRRFGRADQNYLHTMRSNEN
jgi:hypothetical protein